MSLNREIDRQTETERILLKRDALWVSRIREECV